MRTLPVLVFLSFAAAGCVTQQATSLALPRERRTECEANCAKLDLRLTAVVIVRNSAGCVCEPAELPRASATTAGAATVAGAAAIVADEEAEEERQRSSRHNQPGGPGHTSGTYRPAGGFGH